MTDLSNVKARLHGPVMRIVRRIFESAERCAVKYLQSTSPAWTPLCRRRDWQWSEAPLYKSGPKEWIAEVEAPRHP